MGLAKKFLGMNIDQTETEIVLSLREYLQKVFAELEPEIGEFAGKHIPFTDDLNVYEDLIEEETDETLYRSIIGKLMFAANAVRPDLSFRVSQLARYMKNPKAKHMKNAIQVLQYLKNHLDIAIHYAKGGDLEVYGYSDSDWAGHVMTSKSTSGIAFMLGGGLIVWTSKLQTSVAIGVAEAEVTALSEAGRNAMWISSMLKEILDEEYIIDIYVDNLAAISSTNPGLNHSRMKHIRIRLSFIQDEIEKRSFRVLKIDTESNVADLFTKRFHRSKFERLLKLLNLR